jgi:hypothetical protein
VISHFIPTSERIPCFNTLRNWRLKHAFASLCQPLLPSSGPWALLIDESICIGKRRILLVLGVELTRYDFSGPLTFDDIVVLSVKIRPAWQAAHIIPVLKAQQRRGINIAYVVSDRGANLVKAIQELGLPRIDDCGHALALILKREYAKRADFESFNRDCTAFKRRGNISDYAHLMPPALRFHSRFMNLNPVVQWARRMITLLDKHSECELIKPYRQHLEWLLSYRDLIEELHPILNSWQLILQLLKTEGLSPNTARLARSEIQQLDLSANMKNELERYLTVNQTKIEKYPKVICSTDIVESYFGRFKAVHQSLPAAYCITLADYGQTVSLPQVHSAMCKVKLKPMYDQLQTEFGQIIRHKRRTLAKLAEP